MRAIAASRSLVSSALVVAGVLVAGFLTYLLGGLGGAEADQSAVLGLSSASNAVESDIVLELPISESDDAVWPGSDDTPSTLEAVFPVSDGTIVVVDHPGWHQGARIRWMTTEGVTKAQHLAPSGSTLFAPDGSGILYVVAKGGEASEQVVAVTAEGTVESTYTVPLNVNSGLVTRWDGDIWVQVSGTVADLEHGTFVSEEGFVPVARDGRQVTDVQAKDSRTVLWKVGADGLEYIRRRETEQLGSSDIAQSISSPGGPSLRIPDRSIPFGVDSEGRIVLVIPGDASSASRSVLPGWPTISRHRAQLVWASLDGTLRGRAMIPWPLSLSVVKDRVMIAGKDAYVIEVDPDSVRLVRYTVRDAE